MRAISYSRAGDSGVLEPVDLPLPEPGPGEVRVRIAVSGVNPTDWKSRSGTEPKTPQVPNQDGAGVVDAIGADAGPAIGDPAVHAVSDGAGPAIGDPAVHAVSDGAGPAIGDRVWVWDAAYQRSGGTAEEYTVLPAAQVLPLPAEASFDLGASLGIPALTAHLALTAGAPAAPLAPGSLAGATVLVAGGAGAVGHAAIELARWAGATVLSTVSGPEKAALARAAGAQHVIDYRREDVVVRVHEVASGGVDRIVEVNPHANAELDGRLIANGGVIAAYATSSSDPVQLDARPLMGRNVTWHFLLTYTVPDAAKRAAVAGVQAALEAGALHVGEDAGMPLVRFPLERTADAHDAVEQGAVGKVLIDVAAL